MSLKISINKEFEVTTLFAFNCYFSRVDCEMAFLNKRAYQGGTLSKVGGIDSPADSQSFFIGLIVSIFFQLKGFFHLY